MKRKKLSWVFLGLSCLGFLMPKITYADSFPIIPPGFETKWDINTKGSSISRTFSASIDHSYDFGLSFHLTDEAVALAELRKIIGDGGVQYWPKDPSNQKPVQVNTVDEQRLALEGVKAGIYVVKHVQPGITIPIHIKIEMLNDNKSKQKTTIFDEIVNTTGADSWGTRDISRNIASVHLSPGEYIVNLTTTEETALPAWVDTYFYVGGRFFK